MLKYQQKELMLIRAITQSNNYGIHEILTEISAIITDILSKFGIKSTKSKVLITPFMAIEKNKL